MTSDAQATTISVVLVSYGSEEDIAESVSCIPAECEVVVVEQHPFGHAAEAVKAERDDAIVVNAGQNRGFGAGCNLGAANASGDVLLFLNPDARLGSTTATLLAKSVMAHDGGIVAPLLIDGDGRPSTEARRWSRPSRDVIDLLVPHAWIPKSLQRHIPPSDPRYEAGGAVPYVQGACFAVGREQFFAVGGFDESFFLYGEEEHLARQFAGVGLSSLIEPSAVAVHYGQTSTTAVAEFATRQLFRSRVLTYRRDGGRGRAVSGALLTFAGLAVLLVSAPVRRTVKFRPIEDATWCRAALKGTWAGLFNQPVKPPSATNGSSSVAWSVR